MGVWEISTCLGPHLRRMKRQLDRTDDQEHPMSEIHMEAVALRQKKPESLRNTYP